MPLPLDISARAAKLPRAALLIPGLLASAYLVGHLPFLARTPHDLDGVNFILGVREFDIARHQPHPPGYPLLILLGKGTYQAIAPFQAWLGLLPGSLELETLSLALWSAIAGAACAFILFDLFSNLGVSRIVAAGGTALTLACPTFWFMGVRPMSDLPGLAFALGAVAVALRAAMSVGSPDASRTRFLMAAALALAAAAPGVRSQTVWIALPAVLAAWGRVWMAGRSPHTRVVILAGAAGAAVWVVPLLIMSGGAAEYIDALRHQAVADFSHASMLATRFSPTALARALRQTFVAPWGTAWLAAPLLIAAVAGVAALRARLQMGAWLLTMFAGYALFHLAFHEARHVRYALPLVPATAVLAALGLELLLGRAAVLACTAGVAAALALAVPASLAQASTGAPVFQAVEDIRAALGPGSDPPVIAMHEAVRLASRAYVLPGAPIAGEPGEEVRDVATILKHDPDRPVWFLANARRTDLAMIDPGGRRLLKRYRWPFRSDRLLAGSRPLGVDWYQLRAPGWLLLRGWAVTPEIGGRSRVERHAGDPGRPSALVRRRRRPVSLLVGGRLDDGACGPNAALIELVDGIVERRFPLPDSPVFLVVHRISSTGSPGAWAHVEFALERPDETDCTSSVRFDQFDVESGRRPVVGLGEGWFDSEQLPETGELWRWLGASGEILILHTGTSGVRLRLSGEVPSELAAPPQVLTLRSGEQEVFAADITGTFSFDIGLDRAMLDSSGGRFVLQADRTFAPAESGRSPDTRRLSVRFTEVSVGRALPPGTASAGLRGGSR